MFNFNMIQRFISETKVSTITGKKYQQLRNHFHNDTFQSRYFEIRFQPVK